MAALHVRQYAEDVLNLNVKKIIEQGESALAREILKEKGRPTSVISKQVLELDPENLRPTREILDFIGERATEITGVDHDSMVFLAPTLAVPRSDELFKIPKLQVQVDHAFDADTLLEQGTYVADTLQKRTEDSPSQSTLQYIVEWLAESDSADRTPTSTPFATKTPQAAARAR